MQNESHKVISPNLLLSQNEKDIKLLLNQLAKKYNITPEDAAFTLSQVLKKISN